VHRIEPCRRALRRVERKRQHGSQAVQTMWATV
jgi:hypothetical protein